jgi:predicted RNA methylase
MGAQKRIAIPQDNSIKLAKLWPDFVCMEKRAKKEIPFILSQSPKPDPKVFDAALGSGATSIGLSLAGVPLVFSNETDVDFLDIAQREARNHDIDLYP